MIKFFLLSLLIPFHLYAGKGDKSSGCGQGWKVVKRMSLPGSTTRFSTNGTFSNSIAMALGTSGCSKHSIVLNKTKSLHYVQTNYVSLMQDLARGEGQYTAGLAKTFGCSDRSLSSFSRFGKRHYSEFGETANQLTSQMRALLKNHEYLSGQCSNLL